jgi:mannose-6-phosphate isomerase-like protein (cupin superfamily)
MSIDSGPHDLDAVRVIFKPSGDASLKGVSPTFYEELDEFGDFKGHLLVQTFSFDEPWGVWEMHPVGDEFVYLVSGDTDFQVKRPGEEPKTLRVSQPGSYVMVPKGAWHTATPHAPTTMVFVTPGAGTLNLEEPE